MRITAASKNVGTFYLQKHFRNKKLQTVGMFPHSLNDL